MAVQILLRRFESSRETNIAATVARDFPTWDLQVNVNLTPDWSYFLWLTRDKLSLFLSSEHFIAFTRSHETVHFTDFE